MTHSPEEKLFIVSLLKGGYPLKKLCRERKLDRHQVRQWLIRYEKYGEEGLWCPTKGYYFSTAEKEAILAEHLEHGVTIKDLCAKYNVGRGTIIVWIRKVRSGGTLSDVKPRGRPRKKATTETCTTAAASFNI